MKQVLEKRIQHQILTKEEAQRALTLIGKGEVNASQMAAFLMTYRILPITVAELEGFREAMLALALTVDLSDFDAMDIVGTGGDGKDTFNISTTATFVIAGTGQHVAKHGNHGVSSAVGSSTVLEYLGIKFSNEPDFLRQKLAHSGVCFLHAPLFHPAMRFVAPIRKELGIKTFFNMLGPLLNPAHVKKQFSGVYDLAVFDLYHQVFQQAGTPFGVVYALDGYDEISLTGTYQVATKAGIQLLSPDDIGLPFCTEASLHGGSTVEASAQILINILENRGTIAQTNAVLANAATALASVNDLAFTDAYGQVKESLESGRARDVLKRVLG